MKSVCMICGSALLLSMLVAPPVLAQSGTAGASSGTVLQSRNVTYVSGVAAYDDDTWVSGGADGSSFLKIRNNKRRNKTTWILLHGNHLFLNIPGEEPEIITDKPGWGVVSEKGNWKENAKSFSTKKLTRQLVKLYKAHGVLHVPFLAPQEPVTANSDKGATLAEARSVLRRMNLNMMIVGPDDTGRVMAQAPIGGTPVERGTTITVRLDGSTPPTTVPGDTQASAVTLPVATGATTNHTELITPEHTDSATANPTCGRNGSEFFWKINLAAGARDFTASIEVEGGPRMTLSAWEDVGGVLQPAVEPGTANPACTRDRDPSISFTVNAGNIAYIVVDVKPQHLERRGSEELQLEVVWP